MNYMLPKEMTDQYERDAIVWYVQTYSGFYPL